MDLVVLDQKIDTSTALGRMFFQILMERREPGQVLGNVEFGHAGPNLPMPVGIDVALDAKQRTLSLLEPAARHPPSPLGGQGSVRTRTEETPQVTG